MKNEKKMLKKWVKIDLNYEKSCWKSSKIRWKKLPTIGKKKCEKFINNYEKNIEKWVKIELKYILKIIKN